MKIEITFPGNKKTQAHFEGFTLSTDQPISNHGDGTAPAPFDLFLASIGTCAGFFVKSFCDQRNISTEGLGLTQEVTFDEETHRLSEIKLIITLPKDFPEKYKASVISSANLCSVKKALLNPPLFQIETQ